MLRLFLVCLFSGFFAISKGQQPKKLGRAQFDFQNTLADHKLQGKVKSCLSYRVEQKETTSDTIWVKTVYYNEQGSLVEHQRKNFIARYWYNANNQLISIDEDGENNNYAVKYIYYIYDEKGNIITIIKKIYGHTISMIDGKMREDIKTCEEISLDTVYLFYTKYNQLAKTIKVSYNTNGMIEKKDSTLYSYTKKSITTRFVETGNYETKKTIYYRKFNKQHRGIFSKWRNNNGEFSTMRWKYNTKNQVIFFYKKRKLEMNKMEINKTFYTLDEKGNIQKEKTYSTESGEREKVEMVYRRNEQGKILQEQRFVAGELDATWTYEYTPNTEIGLGHYSYKKEYDEFGNELKYYLWKDNQWQLSYFNVIIYYP